VLLLVLQEIHKAEQVIHLQQVHLKQEIVLVLLELQEMVHLVARDVLRLILQEIHPQAEQVIHLQQAVQLAVQVVHLQQAHPSKPDKVVRDVLLLILQEIHPQAEQVIHLQQVVQLAVQVVHLQQAHPSKQDKVVRNVHSFGIKHQQFQLSNDHPKNELLTFPLTYDF
jgi:hypothetical protein